MPRMWADHHGAVPRGGECPGSGLRASHRSAFGVPDELPAFALRACERVAFRSLFGEPVPGAGTLHSALRRCFEGLGETKEAIEEGLIGAKEGRKSGTSTRRGCAWEARGCGYTWRAPQSSPTTPSTKSGASRLQK